MSTRSDIGLLNEDGTVTAIYCHSDGYPEHHVPLLTRWYADEERVRALMALGNLSVLGEDIGFRHDFLVGARGMCTAYGRDRGEAGTVTEARSFETESQFDRAAGNSFAYLFKGGEWWGRSRAGTWRRAVELLPEK